ncbi:MAG: DNA-directed RNA polymerase subunit alpha C-terminal domain-containing protein, partial [Atopobiaceae bacterium]|nr:DNA-directed RNA polymerase subunit alpha C-terminal domain-containing protein [Atopobiaceae bacterium]
EAVLGNVGSYICYPVGARDAEVMARQFDVDVRQLRNIRRYEPVVRLCMGNQSESLTTLAVGRRPEPDNASAPRRIAERMVRSNAWLPVEGSTHRDPSHAASRSDARHEQDAADNARISRFLDELDEDDHFFDAGITPTGDGGSLSIEDGIEDFGFCVRTYNCLKRAGIDTLGMLLELSEEDLASVVRRSKYCIDEVKDMLKDLGLSLKSGE